MGRAFVSSADQLKQTLKSIDTQREQVSEEMEQRSACIPADIGMTGPLIDRDGFPRGDIDVTSIRTHRQRIIMLQNDHRRLTEELAKLLQQLHALQNTAGPSSAGRSDNSNQPVSSEAGTRPPSGTETGANNSAASQSAVSSIPFALVEIVGADSPAEHADLKPGDRILAFGPVSSETKDSFQALSQMMRNASHDPLEVVFMRLGVLKKTTIHPRPWSGPGLVGVKLVHVREQRS